MIFNKKLRKAKRLAKKGLKRKKKAEKLLCEATFLYYNYIKTAKRLERKFDHQGLFLKVAMRVTDLICELNYNIAEKTKTLPTPEKKFKAIKQYCSEYHPLIKAKQCLNGIDMLIKDEDIINDIKKANNEAVDAYIGFAYDMFDNKNFDMYYEVHKLICNIDDTKDYDSEIFTNARVDYAIALYNDRYEKKHTYYYVKYFTVAYYLGREKNDKLFNSLKFELMKKIVEDLSKHIQLSYISKNEKWECAVQVFYTLLDIKLLESEVKMNVKLDEEKFDAIIKFLTEKNQLHKTTTVKKLMKNYSPMGSIIELEYIKYLSRKNS